MCALCVRERVGMNWGQGNSRCCSSSSREKETCPPRPSGSGSGGSIYRDPNAAIECRVKDLISRMTLKEKVAQMTQIEKSVADFTAITQLSIGISSSSLVVVVIVINIYFSS